MHQKNTGEPEDYEPPSREEIESAFENTAGQTGQP